MATTKNHKITTTLQKAISYAMGDKVEDIENMKDDIGESIAYTINDKTGKIIYQTINSTLNCWTNPYDDFMEIIKKYGQEELKYGNKQSKDGKPILAWHWHQNFEGEVDPVLANQIGQKLAKEVFANHKVVIGTHTNTENTHNHIIVCAWDNSGKKWHNHNSMYQHIREVSDRLCEENGLSILQETKKQKLIKWKDDDGVIHYYEPTARKNEMIQQRENGEVSDDSVGSYRNTISYEMSENKKEINRDIVHRDIDRFLPVVTSYEHLLQMLRQIGYTIKDKKKNGEWLQHIVFTPPTADKGIRDYKITDDGFYIRKNLERVIEKFKEDRREHKEGKEQPAISYIDEYIYGKTLINDIDDNFRVRKVDGSYDIVERGEAEKKIIKDVKGKDQELCSLIDTTELDRIIKEQRSLKENYKPRKREEILVQQIQESFQVLRFMEREDLYTQNQINILIESTWKKHDDCIKALNKLEAIISRLEQIMKVPDLVKSIEKRIDVEKDNPEYQEFEIDVDREKLESYRSIMQKYRLLTSEGVEDIQDKIRVSKSKIDQLHLIMNAHTRKLKDYDFCVRVLNRIDYEMDNSESIKESGSIKKQGENESLKVEKISMSRKEHNR